MSQSIMMDKFPSEWQVMQIGDLFEAKAGGDYDPSNSSDVRDNRYPYPIYANGLTQQGLYGFSNYSEEPSGSITVTGRGTLGQAFYRDTPFVAIGRLIVLKPKTSINARFFCEYINYGIEFAVESTGVPQLTAPQISNYLVPVPLIPEQRAIAEVLSDVDGLLNALEALIAKKRAIKQATMQQLLTGKARLPGFSGAWETKRLGDVAHIKTGSKNNEDKDDNGQYPLYVRSAVVERINSYCFDGEAILVPGEGGIEN
ncbi:restriction endonuclease subunit S, partial [Candidatus Poribacteria bacterium]|nr:restriction endonuclease subunit S [Candidatus Poribacteria bacterium]